MAENIDAERAALVEYLMLNFSICEGEADFHERNMPGRRTPSASIGEDGLPELPEPCKSVLPSGWIRYTADQMRQYARNAVTVDRRARGQLLEKFDELGVASPQAAQGVKLAELVHAADAVVERWHSRDWKQPHTAEFINRLAEAVGAMKFAAPPLSSEQQAGKGEPNVR